MASATPSSTPTPIMFGILGCADIARKLSRAILLSPNSTLHAIASRSITKAQAYAEANNFPASTKLYGSYDELLADPDIDAVYLPLPTSLHLHWAVKAAQFKKHVLLEKPTALNVKELDMIIGACEASGVQFMDGTMWMHHPRTNVMGEFLGDSQRFGQLKSIQTSFSFAGDNDFLENDIRVRPDLDALGALGDAGWYCIRACLWAANYELPKFVTALRNPVKNNVGVILSCGASLHWEDGKVGTFHCSFLSNLTMDIAAVGTKGTLHLNDFIIPYEEKSASFSTVSNAWFTDLDLEWNHKPSEHIINTDLPQEVLMVKEFSALVDGIKTRGLAPEKKWPTLSRKTQLVTDAVVASIDRGFEPVEAIDGTDYTQSNCVLEGNETPSHTSSSSMESCVTVVISSTSNVIPLSQEQENTEFNSPIAASREDGDIMRVHDLLDSLSSESAFVVGFYLRTGKHYVLTLKSAAYNMVIMGLVLLYYNNCAAGYMKVRVGGDRCSSSPFIRINGIT